MLYVLWLVHFNACNMFLRVKTCLCMFKHAQAISLLLVLKHAFGVETPSSAAAGRVFSLLSNGFK